MVNGKILSMVGAISRFLLVFTAGMLTGVGVAGAQEMECKMEKVPPTKETIWLYLNGSSFVTTCDPERTNLDCNEGGSRHYSVELAPSGDGAMYSFIEVRNGSSRSKVERYIAFHEEEVCKPRKYPKPDLSEWQNCKVGKFSWTSIVGGVGGDYREDNYSCDDPEIFIEVPRIGDDPSSSPPEGEETERICKSGELCENIELIKSSSEDVPCFGTQCKPDYEKGEHYQGRYADKNGKSVPCFAQTPEACEKLSPDYLTSHGLPCWGDFCNQSGKAPIYKTDDGKVCVGGYCEGATGQNKWGQVIEDGKTVTNSGNSSGGGSTGGSSGGGGSGSEGEGKGDDWGGVGNLPSLPSDGGITDIKIPKSFWDRKYEGKNLESVFKSSGINDAMPSLSGMNLNIGAGACPVFQFEYFGDISPPCWIWDWIRAFFLAVCSFAAFTIIFRRG